MTARTQERRPMGTDGAPNEFDGSAPSLAERFPEPVAQELSDFGTRMLEDAMSAAAPFVWLRRAQDFEDARPRPGEFAGRATAAELAERDKRLAQSAEACRLKADVLRRYPTPLGRFERELVAGLIGGGAA